MGCAVESDWDKDALSMNHSTFIDTLLNRFEVTDFSYILASTSADLGPVTEEHSAANRLYDSVREGLIGVTRPGIANAVQALAPPFHDPCERHGEGALKVAAYLTKDHGTRFDIQLRR